MDIIADTSEFYIEKETAVAIGKFDGIHLGHRRLLDEILALKERGLKACVFTFNPAPAVLFGGDKHVLTTLEEKRNLFARMGIDILVEFPMNSETAATLPKKFVTDYLAAQMNMRFIAAGSDLSFGYKGEGNAKLLESMAAEYGYEVKIVDKVRSDSGEEISSTLVRQAVEAGDMKRAEMLLGTPYFVSGRVVHGNHIGHTLGFPTVNIYPEEDKLLPPKGVYSSRMIWNGKVYNSVTNIGLKPTVGGETKAGAESYIYDFDEEIYGHDIMVYLEEFKRPEKKFDSLADLKAQLKMDIENSRRDTIRL